MCTSIRTHNYFQQRICVTPNSSKIHLDTNFTAMNKTSKNSPLGNKFYYNEFGIRPFYEVNIRTYLILLERDS